MKDVKLDSAADLDLEEAVDWYEDKLPGLGSRFLETVKQAKIAIGKNPPAYPIYKGPIRRFIVKPFAHDIFYVEKEEIVVVLAVYPERDDPAKLERRFK